MAQLICYRDRPSSWLNSYWFIVCLFVSLCQQFIFLIFQLGSGSLALPRPLTTVPCLTRVVSTPYCPSVYPHSSVQCACFYTIFYMLLLACQPVFYIFNKCKIFFPLAYCYNLQNHDRFCFLMFFFFLSVDFLSLARLYWLIT